LTKLNLRNNKKCFASLPCQTISGIWTGNRSRKIRIRYHLKHPFIESSAHDRYHGRYIMKTKTQYFILPGHVTLDSTFLIRFNGQYSYWGSRSKKWIQDPTLNKQSWIEDYFTPVSEKDAQKIIREGVPLSDYRRKNPKMTIQ
jgi:hypothetical protein